MRRIKQSFVKTRLLGPQCPSLVRALESIRLTKLGSDVNRTETSTKLSTSGKRDRVHVPV